MVTRLEFIVKVYMSRVIEIYVRMPETIQAFTQIGDFLKKYIGIKI